MSIKVDNIFMKKLLFLIFFSSHIHSEGFAGNTLLSTNHGQITFDTIDCDTLVQSDENHFQPVLFLSKQFVEKVIQISIADERIVCHPQQVFWCINKSSWICAEDLNSDDLLQTVDKHIVAIDAIEIIEQQTEIYSLTVGPPHYLYVGKHAVLAHNVLPYVIVAAVPLTSTIVVKIATTAVGTGLVTFGAWVANLFAKNRNHKKPKFSVAEKPVRNGSAFFDPNDDKNKHPHGIYEDADYHGLTQNGRKSPRPKDGQEALDNSYTFGKESGGRVAIQDGEFIVLRSHSPGKYHGYRCAWQEVPNKARAVLQKFKLVTKNGNILCKK
jgi:hypothetical protein